MKKKNNNGFTLVELLVTLGLVGIIVSLVMSFFIANIKSYKNINNDTELQYQSQYILNYMTNKVLEAKKVKNSNPESGNNISKISFQYGTEDQCYNFEVKDHKILYGKGTSDSVPDINLGSDVERLDINSLTGGDLLDAKSIEIVLKLKNNNREYEAKQVIYMRNN